MKKILVAVVALGLACADGPLQYQDPSGEIREVNAECDRVSTLGTSAVLEWRDFAVVNQSLLQPEVLARGKLAQKTLSAALDVLEPLCPASDKTQAEKIRRQIQIATEARTKLMEIIVGAASTRY